MIPLNLAPLGFVAVALVVGAIGGYKVSDALHAEELLQIAEAEKEAVIRNQKLIAEIEAQHRETDKKVATEHEKAINTLKHTYSASTSRRMYVQASCPGNGVSSPTDSTGKPNAEVTRTVELSEDTGNKLRTEAYRADEIVETYKSLQHWLIAQGLYK